MKVSLLSSIVAVLLFAMCSVAIAKTPAKSSLSCQETSICVKAGLKCVKHEERKHCIKWETVKENKEKLRDVCLKVSGTKKDKCMSCTKWGKESFTTQVSKKQCAQHKVEQACVKHETVCAKYETKSMCAKPVPILEMAGPVTCPAGQVLQLSRSKTNVARSCVPVPRKPVKLLSCQSYLDPHTKGFNGKHFEWQLEGDYVMVETKDGTFSVHQRLKRFGRYTGTTGFAARANGVDIVEYTKNILYINGQETKFTFGTPIVLANGGKVEVVKKGHTQVFVFAANGGSVSYFDYGSMGNLDVFIPENVAVSGGYCSGENLAFWMKTAGKGLFNDMRVAQFYPNAIADKTTFSATATKNAKIRCQAEGIKKGAVLKECIHDALILRNHPNQRKLMLKVIADVKKEVAKAKKVVITKQQGRVQIKSNINKRKATAKKVAKINAAMQAKCVCPKKN